MLNRVTVIIKLNIMNSSTRMRANRVFVIGTKFVKIIVLVEVF